MNDRLDISEIFLKGPLNPNQKKKTHPGESFVVLRSLALTVVITYLDSRAVVTWTEIIFLPDGINIISSGVI